MEWEHKGVRFTITIEPVGPLVMASARAPKEGMFVRVRPYSAIGHDEQEAVDLLKAQIELDMKKVPAIQNAG